MHKAKVLRAYRDRRAGGTEGAGALTEENGGGEATLKDRMGSAGRGGGSALGKPET